MSIDLDFITTKPMPIKALDEKPQTAMEDGTYLVRDGVVYRIYPRFFFPYSKRINVMTGEIYYPTNADKIRNMTDEELARWIADDLIEPGYFKGDQCYELWLKWLKREAEDDNI